MDRQIDAGQIYRQTDRWMDRKSQTDRQTDKQTDRQADRQTNILNHGWMNGQTDTQIDRYKRDKSAQWCNKSKSWRDRYVMYVFVAPKGSSGGTKAHNGATKVLNWRVR